MRDVHEEMAKYSQNFWGESERGRLADTVRVLPKCGQIHDSRLFADVQQHLGEFREMMQAAISH